MEKFDVLVIGGGPGGYVCAIKAAQLGHLVACVDDKEFLGGTCLNVGCIPSKALLNLTHKYYEASNHFAEYGIEFNNLRFSLQKIMEKKQKIISDLGKGIQGLFAKNKITYFNGKGSFFDDGKVAIKLNTGEKKVISAKNIVIATGSEAVSLPSIKIDEDKIVSSTGALSFNKLPKRLCVIGGGVIGTEMGSIWSRLGSEVTIIEHAPRLLAGFDDDISREFQKILEKQGLEFKSSSRVNAIDKRGEILEVSFTNKDTTEKLECDKVLVSIGRRPYTKDLNLDSIGITLNEKGMIPVDRNFLTSAKGVYAIGDVIAGPMLAHKSEEEGIAVAEIISGQHGHVNYNTIPSVVYTSPEVASIGKTEAMLKKEGIEYRVGKFPFLANSRARAMCETDGFVKILASKNTDEILGAHMIGIAAGDLITEIAVAMEFKAASEDIARICHAHPGLSEAVKEAAFAAFFKPIHM